jgi:hypothetical protein
MATVSRKQLEAMPGFDPAFHLGETAQPTATPPADDADEVRQFMPQVIKLAKRHNWKVYHVYNSRKTDPGWPDLVMLKNGRMLVVELKSAKGVTTPAQDEWLASFNAIHCADILVMVWRPADWPEIEKVLAA